MTMTMTPLTRHPPICNTLMTESFFHPPLYVLRYVYKSSTSGRYSDAEGHVSRSGHSIHLGACEQNTYPSVQLPVHELKLNTYLWRANLLPEPDQQQSGLRP